MEREREESCEAIIGVSAGAPLMELERCLRVSEEQFVAACRDAFTDRAIVEKLGELKFHRKESALGEPERWTRFTLTPDVFFRLAPMKQMALCSVLKSKEGVDLGDAHLQASIQLLGVADTYVNEIKGAIAKRIEIAERDRREVTRSLVILRWLFAGLGLAFFYMFAR